MKKTLLTAVTVVTLATFAIALCVLLRAASFESRPSPARSAVLVQADDMATALRLVRSVGGTVTHELGIIDAVGATLSAAERAQLAALSGVRIYEDGEVRTAGKSGSKTLAISYARLVDDHHNYGEDAPNLKLRLSDGAANATVFVDGVRTGQKLSKKGEATFYVEPYHSSTCTITVSDGTTTVTGTVQYCVPPGGTTGWKESHFPTLIGAARLHQEGVLGTGVGIAVLDTGAKDNEEIQEAVWPLVYYDVFKGSIEDGSGMDDSSGHGSHVNSIALSHAQTPEGTYNGVAPGAHLISVRAFDKKGAGRYADVIKGIDWIVANKDTYDIRVLNCSFSANVQSLYWDDPLNQAVMKAWKAGIVVVASAGNSGPQPMTIGVPGNVPYIITVGAMTDNYTPSNGSDDRLTSFSSAGPTLEGFVKPEVVAPGGHMLGMMSFNDKIAEAHPEFHDGGRPYFVMSGTSQAAAVVSGTVALMLQVNPALTPDQVKFRLMGSAHPAADSNGQLVYSVFQQGAGLIDAYAAAYSTSSGRSNQGLDIAKDLGNVDHYSGGARYDSSRGIYYLEDVGGSGYGWNRGYSWNSTFDGSTSGWGSGYTWNNGFGWYNGYSWNNTFGWYSGFTWNNSFGWNRTFFNNSCCTSPSTQTFTSNATAAPASINTWVEQQ